MNLRIVGLVAALVLAGVATFVLMMWVGGAEERAREAEDHMQVFVAQGAIPAGMTTENAFGQALIAVENVPARLVPEGAIGSLETIAGQVATVDIFEGDIIVAQRFGTSVVAQAGASLEIPEGLEAVTVEAGIVEGVAGFVRAQDRVSLVATLTAGEEAAPDDDEEGEQATTELRTQYIVHDVLVLNVGQLVLSAEEGEQEARVAPSNDRYLFTLAMEPDDVEKAVFATQQGTIWFTILPELEEDQERPSVSTDGRTTSNLFD